MRHPTEIDEYEARVRALDMSPAERSKRIAFYAAGIPRSFWNIGIDDLVDEARDVVRVYVDRIRVAWRGGYGLAFFGPNGSGKSTAASYVLASAIRARFAGAYWTLPGLEADIKRGFSDRSFDEALRVAMFSSDFVVLDELGKERRTAGDDFMRARVEHVLKERYDERRPTILVSNGDPETAGQVYGESIADMIRGRFKTVIFGGDSLRTKSRSAMSREMGWDS